MPPHHPLTCLYKGPLSTPHLTLSHLPRNAAPLSLLAELKEVPLGALASHLEEKVLPSCRPMEGRRGAPFGLHWRLLQGSSRRVQEGFMKGRREVHLGMVKEQSCWSWRGSWRKKESWSWHPLGEEKKSSSLASFGGRQSLLASLQEPSKLLSFWSSIHRNSFFGLEFSLGSKLLLGLALYIIQGRVPWVSFLFLAVEILYGTIEVFFGSYIFHWSVHWIQEVVLGILAGQNKLERHSCWVVVVWQV